MGGGYYTTCSANAYTRSVYNVATTDSLSYMDAREVYKANKLDPYLNPRDVMREARESEEHPTIFPIILGLDVTGSMGRALTMCAGKLNDIMGELYKKVEGVQFCMTGIGDFIYDSAPFQCTQFESDVRILEQTTKIYFERGGGGNGNESYSAAWYFGLYHTDLDCWKRGKKGLIITLGDEGKPKYLPRAAIKNVFGDDVEADIETDELYRQACEKFNIYHIAITNESSYDRYKNLIENTWRPLLGEHLLTASSENLPQLISQIVDDHIANQNIETTTVNVTNEGISW